MVRRHHARRVILAGQTAQFGESACGATDGCAKLGAEERADDE
jgi:hypothetical protein